MGPSQHFLNIPYKAAYLVFLWGCRSVWLELLGDERAKSFEKFHAYLSVGFGVISCTRLAASVMGLGKLITNGKLSWSPLEWESQINEAEVKALLEQESRMHESA